MPGSGRAHPKGGLDASAWEGLSGCAADRVEQLSARARSRLWRVRTGLWGTGDTEGWSAMTRRRIQSDPNNSVAIRSLCDAGSTLAMGLHLNRSMSLRPSATSANSGRRAC